MLPNRRSLSPFGTGTPACMHLLWVTSTTDAARMLSTDQTENEILLIIEQFQIQFKYRIIVIIMIVIKSLNTLI